MTTAEVLALFDDDPQPSILTRQSLYVPGESRGGKAAGREREGGIIVHRPTVAILLPSDFPPLSHRRPDFADLRHVLVRFGFMVDRLAPRRSYVSATITITLDHPDAAVRAQRPSLVTVDSELSDSTTTEFSAALDSMAKLAAQRTQVRETKHPTSKRPVVTAENREQKGFGWHYQAQDDAPLFPQVESARAIIELPRDVTELTGKIGGSAVIRAPWLGVFKTMTALPPGEPTPFRLDLGVAG